LHTCCQNPGPTSIFRKLRLFEQRLGGEAKSFQHVRDITLPGDNMLSSSMVLLNVKNNKIKLYEKNIEVFRSIWLDGY
jgi:hypothetical protein